MCRDPSATGASEKETTSTSTYDYRSHIKAVTGTRNFAICKVTDRLHFAAREANPRFVGAQSLLHSIVSPIKRNVGQPLLKTHTATLTAGAQISSRSHGENIYGDLPITFSILIR